MMGKTNASGVSVISMITANLLLGEGRGGKRKLVSRVDYSREIVNRMCTIREMFQFAVRFAVNSKRVNPVCWSRLYVNPDGASFLLKSRTIVRVLVGEVVKEFTKKL